MSYQGFYTYQIPISLLFLNNSSVSENIRVPFNVQKIRISSAYNIQAFDSINNYISQVKITSSLVNDVVSFMANKISPSVISSDLNTECYAEFLYPTPIKIDGSFNFIFNFIVKDITTEAETTDELDIDGVINIEFHGQEKQEKISSNIINMPLKNSKTSTIEIDPTNDETFVEEYLAFPVNHIIIRTCYNIDTDDSLFYTLIARFNQDFIIGSIGQVYEKTSGFNYNSDLGDKCIHLYFPRPIKIDTYPISINRILQLGFISGNIILQIQYNLE